MFAQLPLKIGLNEESCFETYVAELESVAMAVVKLQASLLQSQGSFFILMGEEGAGKTHLLQAACRFYTETQGQGHHTSSVYLPLSDKTLPLVPAILEGLEDIGMVCIDDVSEIIGDEKWELALASLIIKSQSAGKKLLISTSGDMNDWPIVTKELSIAMMMVYPVKLALLQNRVEIVEALKKRSERLGFDVSTEVGNYLVKQFDNDFIEVLAIFKLIENASIVEKRRITLPFIKKVLS